MTVWARGRSGNFGASGPELMDAAGLGLLPGIGGGKDADTPVSSGVSAAGYGRVAFRTGSFGAGALIAVGGIT